MGLGVSVINFVVIMILPALSCGGNKFFKAFWDVQYMPKRIADLKVEKKLEYYQFFYIHFKHKAFNCNKLMCK